MNEAICRKCGEGVTIRYGEEHTGFCDGCAQEMISELVGALELIRDHDGYDKNNCAMKSSEWREDLQSIASDTLSSFGLV